MPLRPLIALLAPLAAATGVVVEQRVADPGVPGGERALPAHISGVSAGCDRYVAPDGNDRGPGSSSAPWRTAGRLVRGLRPGDVGCLGAGTYREDVTLGTQRITLRARPGQTARLEGRLWVRRGANGVRVLGLVLDGRNARGLPSPTVNAADAQFVGNVVTTNHRGICFLLGSPGWGRATRTVIRQNRIHGCGRLPRTNREHGIYVSEADDTRIIDNVLYDNADRAIQLYPDARRTLVQGNIIDSNGEGVIFSGAENTASRDNLIRGNVISRPQVRAAVESWYSAGTPQGVGNRVVGNCLFGDGRPAVDRSGGGFEVGRNVLADPGFRDAAHGDFRLRPGSRCAPLLAGSRAPAGPAAEPPVAKDGT